METEIDSHHSPHTPTYISIPLIEQAICVYQFSTKSQSHLYQDSFQAQLGFLKNPSGRMAAATGRFFKLSIQPAVSSHICST
jgi:hypothetical protein